MHNGLFPRLDGVLRLYNAGMPQPKRKESQKDDPLFPVTSHLLKPLKMNSEQLADVEAFLHTLNERPVRMLRQPFPPLDTQAEPDRALVPGPDGDPQLDIAE
jgi:cytochrome c peroxidase